MQVEVDPTFPYPNMFLITGRATGASAPPVERVGVFIVKQTVLTDGTVTADQEILMADEPYVPPAPENGEPNFDEDDLTIRLESDIAPTKPELDIAAVRNSFQEGSFGSVRINRGGGFLPVPALNLNWGWRSRLTGPRDALAGDAENFVPDVADPLKLPDGFFNGFFNGGHLTGTGDTNVADHLQANDMVEFHDGTTARQVTIPPGPSLTVTEDGSPIDPPVDITLGVDTVVYDSPAGHFLITWRAVFPWEDRLETATLEVV